MKWYINIILYLLLSFYVLGQDCKPQLIIGTDLQNAKIFINDSLVTESNHYKSELDKGYYKIVVLENSDHWNAVKFVDSVYLKDCIGENLFYSSGKKVYLNSNPQDAFVFMQDSLIGSTPLFLDIASQGLTLKKPGYSDVNVSDTFKSDDINIDLQFIGKQKQEKFISTTAFKILAGTAVALGAVTAYFKLKADDKFDQYRFTGEQDFLDQTRRYDLISGITFSVMQLNFGFILYKFLTE